MSNTELELVLAITIPKAQFLILSLLTPSHFFHFFRKGRAGGVGHLIIRSHKTCSSGPWERHFNRSQYRISDLQLVFRLADRLSAISPAE